MGQGLFNYRENENKFEHALTYEINGQRREVALIHRPGNREDKVGVATFEAGQDEPTIMEYTLEELRVRYDYFSKLKARGLF